MAGNTGKMTREALEARGPRLALARIKNKWEIILETQVPHGIPIYARSFTRSYLERLKRIQEPS